MQKHKYFIQIFMPLRNTKPLKVHCCKIPHLQMISLKIHTKHMG
jgi:hypothetical protein